MTDLTDAIAGQLAAAGIERAAVLGSSYGGWVAQCLARRHPALVRRLLLVHTFALRPDAARRFRLAPKIWKALPAPLLQSLLRARVRRLLRPVRSASPGEYQRTWALVRELVHAPDTAAALLRQNLCPQSRVKPGSWRKSFSNVNVVLDPAARAASPRR
jgi:pimeloyl-ACP methyl ester carboxylesterase